MFGGGELVKGNFFNNLWKEFLYGSIQMGPEKLRFI
jgi:hypothetical protein